MSTPVRNPSVNACGIATSLYKGGISVTKSKPPLQRGESGAAAGGIGRRQQRNCYAKSAHGRNRVRFAEPIYLFFSCTTRVIISTQPSGVRRPESKDRS